MPSSPSQTLVAGPILFFGALSTFTACTVPEDAPSATAAAPTYRADVAPLLSRACGSCHVSGGLAPFALDSYEAASGLADAIVAATSAGSMPPWGTEESDFCRPKHGWKGDVRLTPEQLDLLRAWRDEGTPEGDVDETAPARPHGASVAGWRSEPPCLEAPPTTGLR